MGKIETIGVYNGTITESSLSTTKKGFPQAVLRLATTKKFIEMKEEIEHFQKQGLLQDGQPAYVDYSAFKEEGVFYATLFKSATEFSHATKLLNYEQLQLATGWDGAEFDSFADGSFVGKEVLFRVQEKKAYIADDGKQYGGDGTLEIGWIDHKDAPPQRQLKSVEADQVKSLTAMLKAGIGKPAPKPAAKAPAPKPAAKAPAPKPAPKPAAKAAATVPSTPPVEPATAAPAETDQGSAWAYVNANKGGTEDQAVEEAWIEACSAVGGDKEEIGFTGIDWARVRDLTLSKIGDPVAV